MESGQLKGIFIHHGATPQENAIFLKSSNKFKVAELQDVMHPATTKETDNAKFDAADNPPIDGKSLKQLTRTFVNPEALRESSTSSKNARPSSPQCVAGGNGDVGGERSNGLSESSAKMNVKSRSYDAREPRSYRPKEPRYHEKSRNEKASEDSHAVKESDERRRGRDNSPQRKSNRERYSQSPTHERRGSYWQGRGSSRSRSRGRSRRDGIRSNDSRGPTRVSSRSSRETSERVSRNSFPVSRIHSVSPDYHFHGRSRTIKDSQERVHKLRSSHHDEDVRDWDGIESGRRMVSSRRPRDPSPPFSRRRNMYGDERDGDHRARLHSRGAGYESHMSRRDSPERHGGGASVRSGDGFARTRGNRAASHSFDVSPPHRRDIPRREVSPAPRPNNKRLMMPGESGVRGARGGSFDSGSHRGDVEATTRVYSVSSPPRKRQAAGSGIVNEEDSKYNPRSGRYERSRDWGVDGRNVQARPHAIPAAATPGAASLPDTLSSKVPARAGERTLGTRLMIKGTHPAVPERRIHALVSEFGVVGKIEVLEVRKPEQAKFDMSRSHAFRIAVVS